MDFGIREGEQAVVDLARQILGDLTTNERLKALEAGGHAYDRKLWEELARADLLGTAISESYGGADLGFVALGLFLQEIGRAVAPVPAFPCLVLGALPLARFGSEAHKSAWLPGIAKGERIVTAALCEYDSSDPLAPSTSAVADRDGYRLSGTKSSVPYAQQASHILVPARRDDGGVELFWIEPGSVGVELAAQQTADGQPHAQLVLTDARVAPDARLSGGEEALRWLVERATAARCMMQLGVTERALEMTAAYSRERMQFDRPLGSFQAYHQRAADAYVDVEAIRLSALEAVWRLSCDLPAATHVAVAKFWAAEGGQSAAYACQHLHGGIGIDVDYPLHRYFKWAIQLEHELGAAAHQLDRLGRQIAATGLPPD